VSDIEFDPAKEAWTLRMRGLRLRDAAEVFRGEFAERIDDRRDYGETRWWAIGPIAPTGRLHVVVSVWRDGKRRIISFRRANAREIRGFRDRHG
jgi:hypothetical protein